MRRPKSWTGPTVAVVAVAIAAVVLVGLFVTGVGPFASSSTAGSGGPRYNVTFSETGLPGGITWSVTLGGASQSSGGSIVFSLVNASYRFTVAGVDGYSPSPASGSVTVSGAPQSISVTFTSPNSKPLGASFAWGSPINDSGTTISGCPSSTDHYCYSIEIAGAAVSTSNVQLELRSDIGNVAPWPAGVTVSLFSPTNVSAVATYATSTNLWNLVGPYAGQLAGGFTLVIYTAGTGSAQGLLGVEIVALGTAGYSGSVPSSFFA